MEIEDKSMERQKLVHNDEEEDVTVPTSGTTQSKTPISPPNVRKLIQIALSHPN